MNITKTVYLHETPYGTHICAGSNLSGEECFENYILLASKEVTFNVPDDLNKTALKVAAIDRQIEETHEEYTRRLSMLKDEKAKLLCLENAA